MTDRWSRGEVEQRLAKWNADLQLATQNILELMEDVAYKSLAGDAGKRLEGETARRVTPVLGALGELWEALPALNLVIDDANAKFKKLPWLLDSEPLWQIQKLLEGESVELTTKTTYAQRGLLTPDEVKRTMKPERVMQTLVEAYGQAKAIVVEVGDVIARLGPQLEVAHEHLTALAAAAGSAPETKALQNQIAEAQRRLTADPFGLATTFDRDIGPAIQRVVKAAEAAKRERADAEAAIAGGAARIAELETALAEAIAARDERLAKIVVAREPVAPFERAVIDELVKWLDRLRASLAAAKWHAAKIGITNWTAQLEARIAECRSCVAANRAPLDRRNELRGLIDAYKAKAAATGRAEDAHAVELYRKAYALLHTRPTPLDAAEQVVSQYVAVLR